MQLSERLRSELRKEDTAARLGGDEFVVLISGEHSSRNSAIRQALNVAHKVRAAISGTYHLHGYEHTITSSIGITLFPEDHETAADVLKQADTAMYRAKEAGRARFEFFSRRLNAESRRKIGLERDLRAAFYDDELDVYYQPQFDIKTGVISGAEGLLRWRHGAEGFVSPEEFVPLAEDSDLIVDIGRWVIQKTCRNLRSILNKGLHPGAMSINVSTRQLSDPRFVSDVLEPLHRYNLHPGYLVLEVTETTVAQNRDSAIEVLQQLRKEGVRIAIDDFGTGYSSLSYLQQMPFDIVKIDRSFIASIDGPGKEASVCSAIVAMAQRLRLAVIAEGVETPAQAQILRRLDCDEFQGFLFGRPLPPDTKEPGQLARTVKDMKLSYIVITSVDRDDLRDGGAAHFAECIDRVRELNPGIRV